MSHIYAVEHDHGNNNATGIAFVQADSKAEARRVALENVTVRRLDGAEIYRIHCRGASIIDAATGKVVGSDAEQPEGDVE